MEYPGRKTIIGIRADPPMTASQSKICANEAGAPDDGALSNSSSRVEPPVGSLNNCPLYHSIVPEL